MDTSPSKSLLTLNHTAFDESRGRLLLEATADTKARAALQSNEVALGDLCRQKTPPSDAPSPIPTL
jgi:hypothetical protein